MVVKSKSQEIIKGVPIDPEGVMKVCTKFNGSPSNSCRDISLKIKNVSYMVHSKKKVSVKF